MKKTINNNLLKIIVVLVATVSLIGITGCGLGKERDCAKSTDIIENNFDTFFAFSGSSNTENSKIEAQEIWLSRLLREEDELILKKTIGYDRNKFSNWKIAQQHFQIYLGTKDGFDYVYIDRYNNALKEPLVFKSNLSYSFASIIEEFERLSGKEITQEFLKDCNVNPTTGEPGGIFLDLTFNKHGYALAVEYYWAIIDGQFYVVCPALNEAQTENNA